MAVEGAAAAAAAATDRKILVAVDESEESLHALSWCLKNVVSAHDISRDALVLLYAKLPRAGLYTGFDGTGYLFSSDILATMETYNDGVAASVLVKAKNLCRELVPHVTVEAMVENGDPRDVICQMAEKLCVDLLVMGSHGYGPIRRTFLGSVSNHCAQHVKCPVLIVKRPK